MAAATTGGRVEFFLGPMFAGKTFEVSRCLHRARLGGSPGVFIKFAGDDRYGAGPAIRTHDGTTATTGAATADLARLRVVEAERLGEVALAPDELDVGVDEGQFYPDLRDALDRWSREGRRVYVAALDGDFRRRPFAAVSEALPLAEAVTKLTAVCTLCRADASAAPVAAPFTVRTGGSTAVRLIGGGDKYRAACLDCFLRSSD